MAISRRSLFRLLGSLPFLGFLKSQGKEKDILPLSFSYCVETPISDNYSVWRWATGSTLVEGILYAGLVREGESGYTWLCPNGEKWIITSVEFILDGMVVLYGYRE